MNKSGMCFLFFPIPNKVLEMNNKMYRNIRQDNPSNCVNKLTRITFKDNQKIDFTMTAYQAGWIGGWIFKMQYKATYCGPNYTQVGLCIDSWNKIILNDNTTFFFYVKSKDASGNISGYISESQISSVNCTAYSWSRWNDLGGTFTSGPAACSWGKSRLDIFARSTDNAMWHKWWDGASWSGW